MLKIKISAELSLEQLMPGHAEDVFRLIDKGREGLRKWLPFIDNTQKPEDTLNYINSLDITRNLVMAVIYKGRPAGLIGFKDTDFNNKKSEIGYWLGNEYRRKGLMIQSCMKMIEYGFSEMGLNRIEIKVAAGNVRSSAIPKKAGFKFEGKARQAELVNGKFHDLEVYSMLKSEFCDENKTG